MSHTKPVHRGRSQMLTLDPHLLARGGSVHRVSFTVRRRVGLRAVVLLLLGGLVLLGAVVMIALSGAGLRDANAQVGSVPACRISAPPLPQSQPVICLQPRAFIPIVTNAR